MIYFMPINQDCFYKIWNPIVRLGLGKTFLKFQILKQKFLLIDKTIYL